MESVVFKCGKLTQNLGSFVKRCGNSSRSRFYEQILKLEGLILLENSFSFSYVELTLFIQF
ncbi:hypothetical protein FFZ99_08010 [Leptospira interrogans]|nr:hypothetical protein B2G47_01495 [Leptospira interrogans serovar Canicola]TQE58488.1 hypothetical protein FF006_08260 [Leptospira interrogans]ASV10097.1 hypothetical protein B2G50_05865 [Leptospira interrogans serovar Canicola]TQE63404.1 hypothetical protein FFZ99_08010 [Leptospira interrogans]TQE67626.1 hypothetical protein FF001_06065 [Leptospira interrogans]